MHYDTVVEYRRHFERRYCRGAIVTFDEIQVRFRKGHFDHCFFESVGEKDDTFSRRRAERIDWIKAALADPDAELRVGWDSRSRRPATDRRVVIVVRDYVVVIRLIGGRRAEFVTAFVAGDRTLRQIRTNPRWPQKNR